ncbi:ATP-dependent Clp protease proteolytic subunit [Streptomyces sp. NPDC090022]|uniref:ATP-dependent Clp protease proteolytic subunit n=1 Tax=Streptomyces sp. NPDC090022 TaxID=3365920 RepID=UPI00380B0779
MPLPTSLPPRGYAPRARHVVPHFTERTAYGVREYDPYAKLFEERIVILGSEIDDVSANDVMAQLMCLEAADPDRDISLYINSPGGSLTSLMAVYDTMRYVRPDIQTVCVGQATSAASVVLAAGTRGKRIALPNSRVLMHQPATGGAQGQVSDLEIQAREIERLRDRVEEILAEHTGRDRRTIREDLDRDKILTAQEALEYGIVDQVIVPRGRAGQGPA